MVASLWNCLDEKKLTNQNLVSSMFILPQILDKYHEKNCLLVVLLPLNDFMLNFAWNQMIFNIYFNWFQTFTAMLLVTLILW